MSFLSSIFSGNDRSTGEGSGGSKGGARRRRKSSRRKCSGRQIEEELSAAAGLLVDREFPASAGGIVRSSATMALGRYPDGEFTRLVNPHHGVRVSGSYIRGVDEEMGAALLTFDVKAALVARLTPLGMLKVMVREYVSGGALSAYVRGLSVGGPVVGVDVDESNESHTSWFKRHYRGGFRLDYLDVTFPWYSGDTSDWSMLTMP